MSQSRAALVYFSLVFAAGFALGMVRVPMLVPLIGVRYAELAEMPFMLVAIVFAARFVRKRHAELARRSQWLAVGALALALMLIAEWLLAVVLSGGSVATYIAAKDPISGAVYAAMLLVYAAMPSVLWRRGAQ